MDELNEVNISKLNWRHIFPCQYIHVYSWQCYHKLFFCKIIFLPSSVLFIYQIIYISLYLNPFLNMYLCVKISEIFHNAWLTPFKRSFWIIIVLLPPLRIAAIVNFDMLEMSYDFKIFLIFIKLKSIKRSNSQIKIKKLNVKHGREEDDIGLFITRVPKVLQ